MPVLVCHSARCNPTNWIDLHIARFPFLSVEPPWLSFPSAPCWHTRKHTRVRVVRYCSAPSRHVSLKKRSICKLMGRNGVFIQEKPQVKGKLEIRIYPSERTLPSLRSTSGRVEQTDGPGEDSLQPSDYQTEWDTHIHTHPYVMFIGHGAWSGIVFFFFTLTCCIKLVSFIFYTQNGDDDFVVKQSPAHVCALLQQIYVLQNLYMRGSLGKFFTCENISYI